MTHNERLLRNFVVFVVMRYLFRERREGEWESERGREKERENATKR